MAEVKTYYRPGLRFKAHQRAQGHEECCFKGAEEFRNPDGTLQREAIRPLWAEFGVFGNSYSYIDPDTDRTETGHEFRGGFFDLDLQAEDKGWTDSEKEIVARHMLTMLDKGAQFTLDTPTPTAAPWPTYDTTHHKQIPTFAAQLGLAQEALRYEQQNKKRPEVIEKLREALATPVPVPDPEDDLIAA